jgi:hypothetical protein
MNQPDTTNEVASTAATEDSSVTQLAPEWRKLGPDEVIGASDEYNPASLGDWIKVPHGWIGEKCDITKIRTRRPSPVQEQSIIDRNLDMLDPYRKGRMHPDNEREYVWETLKLLRDEIQKLKEAR